MCERAFASTLFMLCLGCACNRARGESSRLHTRMCFVVCSIYSKSKQHKTDSNRDGSATAFDSIATWCFPKNQRKQSICQCHTTHTHIHMQNGFNAPTTTACNVCVTEWNGRWCNSRNDSPEEWTKSQNASSLNRPTTESSTHSKQIWWKPVVVCVTNCDNVRSFVLLLQRKWKRNIAAAAAVAATGDQLLSNVYHRTNW